LLEVGDVEVAGLAVEGEGPRVAEAVGPDLGLRLGMDLGKGQFTHAEQRHLLRQRDERVAGRDVVGPVRGPGVHVDAEHLAQPGVEILAGADDVALPAPVAHAHVEVTVGAEGDLAAMMVAVGEVDVHDHPGAVHVGLVRVVLRHAVFGDQRGAVEPQVGVAHVEQAVLLELGMKLQAVEPLFEEGAQRLVLQVEERLLERLAVLDDLDDARPFADEEAARTVVRRGNMHRVHEAVGHLDELDGDVAGEFAARLDGRWLGVLREQRGGGGQNRRKGEGRQGVRAWLHTQVGNGRKGKPADGPGQAANTRVAPTINAFPGGG
jgi:hypothetical protein